MSIEYERSDELQCCWDKWVFIDPTKLELYLPEYNCTDMGGCIRVAKALMPKVNMITVFEAGVLTTNYKKIGGKWKAECYDRPYFGRVK